MLFEYDQESVTKESPAPAMEFIEFAQVRMIDRLRSHRRISSTERMFSSNQSPGKRVAK